MMPSDALKLAEEALETSKCYLRIYSDERLHKDTWEGSEDQATLDTDKEECEKALTAIRAARAEWGWRPIADAPRDGTWILTWVGGVVKPFPYICAWSDSYSIHGLGGNWNDGLCQMGIEVTHWQPLPPPPAREEVGNG